MGFLGCVGSPGTGESSLSYSSVAAKQGAGELVRTLSGAYSLALSVRSKSVVKPLVSVRSTSSIAITVVT